jgi:hypothetical protein
MQTIYLFIIVIIILLCTKQNKENWFPYPEKVISEFKPYLTNCKKCSYLRKEECDSCLNCGWCIDGSGNGKCVPGDSKGPHFNNDCQIWRHPYRFHRFKPRFSGRIFRKSNW